ncbi:hypothetical protein B0T19DRAFT_479268 [Cercophora scortea]|uniref:Uncharacterized protein n=1 Tax=Cercophora scortea TaxID=314031 RepID=A0AAE0I8N6_9PEZI|nr:hypothetical protein B0T19DRAFT_479268 [Cercophora scortea]
MSSSGSTSSYGSRKATYGSDGRSDWGSDCSDWGSARSDCSSASGRSTHGSASDSDDDGHVPNHVPGYHQVAGPSTGSQASSGFTDGGYDRRDRVDGERHAIGSQLDQLNHQHQNNSLQARSYGTARGYNTLTTFFDGYPPYPMRDPRGYIYGDGSSMSTWGPGNFSAPWTPAHRHQSGSYGQIDASSNLEPWGGIYGSVHPYGPYGYYNTIENEGYEVMRSLDAQIREFQESHPRSVDPSTAPAPPSYGAQPFQHPPAPSSSQP